MSSKTTEVRLQEWVAPLAVSNTAVHAAIALPASGTTVVTTAIINPDFARTIRLKGNATTTQGVSVILVGTDILGNALTETVVMGNAFATPTDSLNAFKTVTSITVPTQGAGGDTISVGLGASLGLDSYCDKYSFIGQTGITSFTNSITAIGLNVVVSSVALDGSTDQAVCYLPAIFPAYSRIWG